MTHPRLGTHQTHCCKIHGCKYDEDSCPVASQEFDGIEGRACEECCEDSGDYDSYTFVWPDGRSIEVTNYFTVTSLLKGVQGAEITGHVIRNRKILSGGKK